MSVLLAFGCSDKRRKLTSNDGTDVCPSLAGVPVVIFCFHQCKRFNFYERLNRFLIHLIMHFSVLLLVYKTKSNILFLAANYIPLVRITFGL